MAGLRRASVSLQLQSSLEDVAGDLGAGVGVDDVSVRRALDLFRKATDLALECAPVVVWAREEGAVELLQHDGAEGGRQDGALLLRLAQETEPCIWCLLLNLQRRGVK